MPITDIRINHDQKNEIGLTGIIELRGPNPTLSVRKCGSDAVLVCFKNSTASTVSTVGAAVSSSLLAGRCLGASACSVDGHLILGH